MVRISGRVFSLYSTSSRPRTDIKLADCVGSLLLTRKHAKEIVWAMLDFAANVCTARKPKCMGCFVVGYCRYERKCCAEGVFKIYKYEKNMKE